MDFPSYYNSGGDVHDETSNGDVLCKYSHLYYAVNSDSKTQVILWIIKHIVNNIFCRMKDEIKLSSLWKFNVVDVYWIIYVIFSTIWLNIYLILYIVLTIVNL